MKEITWDEFTQVELRVGTVVEVSEFPEARKPAWKLQIDFGEEIGLRKSSAQITDLYDAEDLLGRQVDTDACPGNAVSLPALICGMGHHNLWDTVSD